MTHPIQPASDAELIEIRDRLSSIREDWSHGYIEHVSFADEEVDEPGEFYSKGPTYTCHRDAFWSAEGDALRSRARLDSLFIRHAPSDLRKLLARIEAQDAKLREAEEALEKIAQHEWEVISQSTGMRQSGPSEEASIAKAALAKIGEGR